jgi:2'-5' RNA ligase
VRLFVALELPRSARLALAAWAGERVDDAIWRGPARGACGSDPARGRLRAVPAANLHVTLCFLGERPDASAHGVGEAVAAGAAGTEALALTITGSLWLPPRRPRVLAVGCDGPGLAALQARVTAALVTAGWYAPERRPYRGHVTVARMVGAGGSGPPSSPGAPPPLGFTAGTVAVLRSHLGEGPVRYEPLARVRLGALPAAGDGSAAQGWLARRHRAVRTMETRQRNE